MTPFFNRIVDTDRLAQRWAKFEQKNPQTGAFLRLTMVVSTVLLALACLFVAAYGVSMLTPHGGALHLLNTSVSSHPLTVGIGMTAGGGAGSLLSFAAVAITFKTNQKLAGRTLLEEGFAEQDIKSAKELRKRDKKNLNLLPIETVHGKEKVKVKWHRLSVEKGLEKIWGQAGQLLVTVVTDPEDLQHPHGEILVMNVGGHPQKYGVSFAKTAFSDVESATAHINDLLKQGYTPIS